VVDGLLGDGVGGHDRGGGGEARLRRGRRLLLHLISHGGDTGEHLVHREGVADETGGAHGNLAGGDPEGVTDGGGGGFGVLLPPDAVAGVGVAGVEDDGVESAVVVLPGVLDRGGEDLVTGEKGGGGELGAVVDDEGEVGVAGGLDACGGGGGPETGGCGHTGRVLGHGCSLLVCVQSACVGVGGLQTGHG
jgi:hypothetical protein